MTKSVTHRLEGKGEREGMTGKGTLLVRWDEVAVIRPRTGKASGLREQGAGGLAALASERGQDGADMKRRIRPPG